MNNNINNQFSFLERLNIMSFDIALMNLNENLGQGDKQDILENFSRNADTLLSDIRSHLAKQDEKIDKILEVLTNESR